MATRVIIPPEPILTPDQISAAYAGDNTDVAGMIAAVTAKIDGPNGWLGRSLGPQTLELSLPGFDLKRAFLLPCRPIIEIEAVLYLDEEGNEQEVDEQAFRKAGDMIWFVPSFSFPATNCAPDAVKIRYKAGYDGNDVRDGGTGAVPDSVKRAIILSVLYLTSISKDDLFLRAEEVDGVGRTEFTVSEQAGAVIERSANQLLQGLRVYS